MPIPCPFTLPEVCTLELMDAICGPFLCHKPPLETCRGYIRLYLSLAYPSRLNHSSTKCTSVCRYRSAKQLRDKTKTWYDTRTKLIEKSSAVAHDQLFLITDLVESTVDEAVLQSLKRIAVDPPGISVIGLCAYIKQNFRFADTPALAPTVRSTTLTLMVRLSLGSLVQKGEVVCTEEKLYSLPGEDDEATLVNIKEEAMEHRRQRPVDVPAGTMTAVDILMEDLEVSPARPSRRASTKPRGAALVPSRANSEVADAPPVEGARGPRTRAAMKRDRSPEILKVAPGKAKSKSGGNGRTQAEQEEKAPPATKNGPKSKKRERKNPFDGPNVVTRGAAKRRAALAPSASAPSAAARRTTTIQPQSPQALKRKAEEQKAGSGKRLTGKSRANKTVIELDDLGDSDSSMSS